MFCFQTRYTTTDHVMHKNSITYVIKEGAGQFELVEALRIKPVPKMCGQVGHRLRCFSGTARRMAFTDIDAATHVVESRIQHPVTVHRLWFQAPGYTLGYTKPMRIGNPTVLPSGSSSIPKEEGRLMNRLILPDAASDVAQSGGAWHIACRDGTLYTFRMDGSQLWKKGLPRLGPDGWGGRRWESGSSPSPIVAAAAGRVVLDHEDRFWLLDQFGNTHWETRADD